MPASSPMAKYWFGKRAPEHADGWYAFYKSVKTQGVLDAKTKELVAAAVGLVMRCEHCVEAHAKDALRAGATKEEVAEALMVASQIASASQLFFMSEELDKLLADS